MATSWRIQFVIILFAITSVYPAFASPILLPRQPLTVAPAIEGLLICDEALKLPEIKTSSSAEHWCVSRRKNAGPRLEKFLDELEPGGAKGKIQLGYMLTIQLLTLYKKTSEKWEIDTDKIASYLNIIQSVDRPVVVYLASGHFDTKSELASELAQNPINLLQFPNNPVPVSNYLGHKIIPFTLLTDESIPVNKYRFDAMRVITREIKNLPTYAFSRIKAITLAGEIHHMFPDFENGMGNYTNATTTDYSMESQLGFRTWLEDKYKTVAKLNSATGLTYASFRDISAPSKNIRYQTLSSFGEHYDAYADGILPFSGWLWDPTNKVTQISLHVDGKKVGNFLMGMGRLDVYRAEKSVSSASAGFRYDMDFSKMKPGKYLAQVIAYKKDNSVILDERYFSVISPDQSPTPESTFFSTPARAHPVNANDFRWWIDIPKPNIDIYYNPIASDWNAYRNQQVKTFLEKFYYTARKAGLQRDLLFSHQILARANSTWNPQLFATDLSISNTTPWHSGINMYGGSTYSEWTKHYLKNKNIVDYGIPEFNPQQWKNDKIHEEAFLFHYKRGARFISPYYYTLLPEKMRGETNQFQINPENFRDGANLFDAAIKNFVKN